MVTTTSGTPAAGIEVLIVGERSSFYGAVYTDTNGFYSQSVLIDGYYIIQVQPHPTYGSFVTEDGTSILFTVINEHKVRDFVQMTQ